MLLAHVLNGAHVVTALHGPVTATIPAYLVTIPDLWLTFVIGTVLPMIVALVTNRFADSAVKAGVLVLLSVIGGALAQIQAAGGRFDLVETLTAVFMTFVTAVGLHFGLLKVVGLTGSGGAIARKVPGGIGRDVNRPVPASTPETRIGRPPLDGGRYRE